MTSTHNHIKACAKTYESFWPVCYYYQKGCNQCNGCEYIYEYNKKIKKS